MQFGMARRLGAALALTCGLAVCGTAQAQHVVTEDEAAKLTLEALTAPPPPPRPIYRAYLHRAMASRIVWRDRRNEGVSRDEGWRGERWHERATTRVAERHLIRRSGSSGHVVRLHHHR